MIWGVHGSPANRLTRPIWSKCKPVGIALACTGGFLTCAQPASNAAAATDKINAEFFISENAELLGRGSNAGSPAGQFCVRSKLRNVQHSPSVDLDVPNLFR